MVIFKDIWSKLGKWYIIDWEEHKSWN